jgi:hypothetical protein
MQPYAKDLYERAALCATLAGETENEILKASLDALGRMWLETAAMIEVLYPEHPASAKCTSNE